MSAQPLVLEVMVLLALSSGGLFALLFADWYKSVRTGKQAAVSTARKPKSAAIGNSGHAVTA